MTSKISIVIPCYNEEEYIAILLDSIVAQTFDINQIEVWVVDGFSTDKTREILDEYTKQYSKIRLIDNPAKYTPQALNLGIKASDADFVMILGAHSVLDADYVQKALVFLKTNKEIDCLGGLLENEYQNSESQNIGLAMSSSFGVGNAYFRTGLKSGYVDTVAFGIYKKEVFDKIGYFDEDLVRNQDDEFNYRLIKNGLKIYLLTDLRAKYFVRASFAKVYKQFYQYGYWKVYVNKKHGSVTTLRQLIPFFFVMFLFSGVVLPFWGAFVYLWLPILFLYLILAFVYAFKKIKQFKNGFQLVRSFITIHYAYGYGYFRGIIDFLFFNKMPDYKTKNLSR
jgi:glycosyltransferase involved in cell wall biosynthesis